MRGRKTQAGKENENSAKGGDKTKMRDYARNPWIVIGDKRMSSFADMGLDPLFFG